MRPISSLLTTIAVISFANDLLAVGNVGSAVLVTPIFSKTTLALSADGEVLHEWPSAYEAAAAARLLPDGSILRIGSAKLGRPFAKWGVRGGQLERISKDGQLLWSFWDAVDDHTATGDAIILPNGHVLTAVLEFRTKEECIAAGRDVEKVGDHGGFFPGLIEFEPHGREAGVPVWRWSLWDHVGQKRHPALPRYGFPNLPQGVIDVDVEASSDRPNWLRIVWVHYIEELKAVAVLVQPLGDIWLIDHETSTQEAATSTQGSWGRGGRPVSLQTRFAGASADVPHATAAVFLPGQEALLGGSLMTLGTRPGTLGTFLQGYAVHLKQGTPVFAEGHFVAVHSPPVAPGELALRLDGVDFAMTSFGPQVLVTSGQSGLHFSGSLTAESFTPKANAVYKNLAGMRKFTLRRKSSPNKANCCGGGKSEAAIPLEGERSLQIAPLGTSRYLSPAEIDCVLPTPPFSNPINKP